MSKIELIKTFSRAVDKDGLPQNTIGLLDAVYKVLPQLEGEAPTMPEQGHFAHVVFLGDYIIKAPKINSDSFALQKAVRHFNQECFYLRETQKALTLNPHLTTLSLVPEIKYIDDALNFCIMNRKHGVTVNSIANTKTCKDDKRIAKTLARFTHEFAQVFPAKNFPKLTPHDQDEAHKVLSDVNATKKLLEENKIHSILGEERYTQYKIIINETENFYKDENSIIFHNDYHGGNIILNPNDYGDVTGIIDFGETRKILIPEKHAKLAGLKGNIKYFFNEAYAKHRNTASKTDVLTTLDLYSKVQKIIRRPQAATEANIRFCDNLITQFGI